MQSDFNSWDEFGQMFMVKLRVDAKAADAADAPVIYHYVNTTVPLQSWAGLAVVDAMATPSTVIEAGKLASWDNTQHHNNSVRALRTAETMVVWLLATLRCLMTLLVSEVTAIHWLCALCLAGRLTCLCI